MANKKSSKYVPPKKILEKYADVLINFALGSGKGIKKGDVVQLSVQEAAKPLYIELCKAVWKKGGHVRHQFIATNDEDNRFEHHFYHYAEEHQLRFSPTKFMREFVKLIDHNVHILANTDKKALSSVDPKKIMRAGEYRKKISEWFVEKENKGKFTWTIGLYGTEAMAKEAGLTLEEYWQEIINACFLDQKNPVKKWKEVFKDLERYRQRLNKLEIDRLHVLGKDVDLWVKIGEKRRWNGGSGRNIPSFELFTSPDWRGTNGWIKFNQPLYRYGNLITGIELEFENGVVVKSKAKKNEKLLKQMIATKNANKIGEFSMTDKRFSRISKFMAETLYDENIGGPNGNSHLALGNAYHDCFSGNSTKNTKTDWKRLGFNSSSVHTDIITTTPRIITAYLKNGKQKVIYRNGQYNF